MMFFLVSVCGTHKSFSPYQTFSIDPQRLYDECRSTSQSLESLNVDHSLQPGVGRRKQHLARAWYILEVNSPKRTKYLLHMFALKVDALYIYFTRIFYA